MTVENDSVNQSDHAVEFRHVHPVVSIFSRDYLTMKPIIAWLRDIAPRYASGILLDYGCGNKPYYSFFEHRVAKYLGIDVTQNTFQTVDCVVPPGVPIPFADDAVDTVLSTQVLEHIAEPGMYVREIARVLKPGGHCILTCPGSFMLHEEPEDYFRYTKYGIEFLIRKHGMHIVRVDTAGGAWRLIGQIFLNHKAFGRKLKVPILSTFLYYGWVFTGNILFSILDMANTNAKDTANYMIIARK